MMNKKKIYPRTGDHETIYLKNVITNPNIIVGDYTMYNDFVTDPTLFEKIMFSIIIPLTTINCILENFVLLPAELASSLIVQTTA